MAVAGGAADLIMEDDGSDPRTLEDALPRVAARCDGLPGPYPARLTRKAARHQTVLVRWTVEGLVPARAGYPGAAPA